MMPQRYVYLFRRDRRYKIGVSECPSSRFKDVVPRRETDKEHVHEFPSRNAHRIEKALHRRFAADAVPGENEWFYLNHLDVLEISHIKGADDIDDLPLTLRPDDAANNANVPLYADIPVPLKAWFDAIAEAHGRKINAELIIVLERYCRVEEAKLAESEESQP